MSHIFPPIATLAVGFLQSIGIGADHPPRDLPRWMIVSLRKPARDKTRTCRNCVRFDTPNECLIIESMFDCGQSQWYLRGWRVGDLHLIVFFLDKKKLGVVGSKILNEGGGLQSLNESMSMEAHRRVEWCRNRGIDSLMGDIGGGDVVEHNV